MKVSEFVNKKLVVQREVTAYTGYPGSERTETWEPTFVTPEIYSYVDTDTDGLYWMFNDGGVYKYVKHDPEKLSVKGSGVGNPLNLIENLTGQGADVVDGVISRGQDVAKIALVFAGVYFSFMIYNSFK